MSSETLYVEFEDGHRLWGIYFGTADCVLGRLFDTEEEAADAFFGEGRSSDVMFLKDEAEMERAKATAEPVRFFTNYGVADRDGPDRGFRELEWDGRASRVEKVVVSGFERFEYDPWAEVYLDWSRPAGVA